MKQSKRGFTIVELVIVIAVIAVLAAVLIPTFSSLIKKANLSSDMQAVREMNLALAADEELYGAPTNIEQVMKILADAGYNADNWKTLTKGYEVYWYQERNRLVLYSAAENDVVYPEEFQGYMTNIRNEKGEVIRHFYLYNQNVKAALEADITLGSSTGGQSIATIESSASTESEKAAISSVNNAITNSVEVKASLGLSDSASVYVNGSRELVSETYATGNYASMQVMRVSSSKEVDATSSGDVAANLYFISITTAPGATATEISTAQKAASNYVYTLFTQMNADKADDDATVLLKGGTVLDASDYEWKPVKTFSGYFGTTEAEAPVVVEGAQLTNATGYVETLSFDGSQGKYFVTGFFGALYGDAVVENLTYSNSKINQPGSDFDMSKSSKTHSRNSIGIIGGVIDIPNKSGAEQFKQASNVVIRNVTVESTVSITGAATAAGLIGYVGGSGDGRAVFNGSLLLDNCRVSATVVGGPESGDYGPCGGLIGFSCRACEAGNKDGDGVTNEFYNIIIRNCKFDGSVKGYRAIGAAVGNIQNGLYVFEGVNDFSGATLDTTNCTDDDNSIVGLIGKASGTQSVVIFTTADDIKLGSFNAIGADAAASVQSSAETDFNKSSSAYHKLDTIEDAEHNSIGANNGIWG